jgi:hypothetical protein
MLGVRFKDVFCVNLVSMLTVDDSVCDPATKPRTNYTSCNPQACTGYNWMANGNWGPCENGIRTRTFHCHTPDGGAALDVQCGNVIKPISTLACSPGLCLKVPGASVSDAFSIQVSCVLVTLLLFL